MAGNNAEVVLLSMLDLLIGLSISGARSLEPLMSLLVADLEEVEHGTEINDTVGETRRGHDKVNLHCTGVMGAHRRRLSITRGCLTWCGFRTNGGVVNELNVVFASQATEYRSIWNSIIRMNGTNAVRVNRLSQSRLLPFSLSHW